MTQAPPALPGIITDPLWSYVFASYAIAAVALLALTMALWLNARRWAARAKKAARAEAATRP